jgi:hypothetical protein
MSMYVTDDYCVLWRQQSIHEVSYYRLQLATYCLVVAIHLNSIGLSFSIWKMRITMCIS